MINGRCKTSETSLINWICRKIFASFFLTLYLFVKILQGVTRKNRLKVPEQRNKFFQNYAATRLLKKTAKICIYQLHDKIQTQE